MKNCCLIKILLLTLLFFSPVIAFSSDLLDYYISFSLLTNFHTRRVYYDFNDISRFNYHYRLNDTSDSYYETNSIFTNFTADRFNKAQYTFFLSVSPKNRDYFINFEYSFSEGRASFPLLGGTRFSGTDTIYFLEKDVWEFSRMNHGISFKGLIKDLGSMKAYYVIGIDYMNMDFDIIRHHYTINNDNISHIANWNKKSYSEFGFNLSVESNYIIYKEIRLFLKIGYRYYEDNRYRIESGPEYQHSDVQINPSSFIFQLGVIHKL